MKSKQHHRSLAFEELEPKAAPSSVLLVAAGSTADSQLAQLTTCTFATDAAIVPSYQYETDHLLRYIEQNTDRIELSHGPVPPPTSAQCAASDEMMSLMAGSSNSLFVLGFYDGEPEL